MKLEHIGGTLVVLSAVVFLAGYAIPAVKQYSKWAEYGVIGGAGLYVLGKVM